MVLIGVRKKALLMRVYECPGSMSGGALLSLASKAVLEAVEPQPAGRRVEQLSP
jgi:hypothetical protein